MSADTSQSPALDLLSQRLKRIATLGSCEATLSWDEQVLMPPKGGEARAEQLALLAELKHEWCTSSRHADAIAGANEELTEDSSWQARRTVEEAQRQFEKATKLPLSLVTELTKTGSKAQHVWAEARSKNDFALFQPWLEKMIGLKQEEAAVKQAGEETLYDVMLDDYEPGMTSKEVARVFSSLRDDLSGLLKRITDSGTSVPRELVESPARSFSQTAQDAFSKFVVEKIGFDFQAGRADISVHPFCSGNAPGDCRITTRFDEHNICMALFGMLHEAGHGMYEQGLLTEYFGTAPGEFVSLGIHESQSRFWENNIGRSLPFWKQFYPQLQQYFPGQFDDVSLEQFYRAINEVRQSMIRVEADEVTYSLHVILRFELEQALLSGDLKVADLPQVWNENMERSLGVVPTTDAEGCLQDVHWSCGLFGYFPTYALGNMYAAQFWATYQQQQPTAIEQVETGEFRPIHSWLNEAIHAQGKRYSSTELVSEVCGEVSSQPLIDYLTKKYEEIYHL